jgi:hypothetical protein
MSLFSSAASVAGQAVINASPAIKDKALAIWHKATGGAVTSVPSAVEFGSAGPGQLSIITRGVVHAGINPREIFEHDVLLGMDQGELAILRRNLTSEFTKLYGPIDNASTVTALPTVADQIVLLSAIRAVGERFGLRSSESIAALHVQLRLFLGLSETTLRDTLALRAAL